MKKEVGKFKNWADDQLRRMCGKLSPERRLITILALCVIFGSLSIYMTVSSIYNIGKRDAELMHIEHIKQLDLPYTNDSINRLKLQPYERQQSNEGE